jgi:hypothetical protein
MKKIMFFALAALFGMSLNASAQTEKSTDTFTYEVSGDDAIITGFVNGLSASKMATVTIPATIKGSGSKTYNVVAIDGTASKSTKFAGNGSIKTLKLAANSNLTTIAAGSFKGAKNLATVSFANGGKLKYIQEEAFEGTAITTFDLTPTIVEDIEQVFTDPYDASVKNKKLTTVKFSSKLKNINYHAFQNCMQLTTLDFSKCNQDVTIGAYAFDYALFLTELELPACVARIADYAFDGSRIEKLTINANSKAGKPTIGAMGGSKLTSITVNGAFQGVFGLDDSDSPVAVSTDVTSLTFNGAVATGAIGEGSFVDASKLANVTFNSTIAVDGVAEGAFGDGTNFAGESVYNAWGGFVGLTINYSPAESSATKVKSFNAEAFAPSAGTNIVKLQTATWYKAWIESKYTIYRLNIIAAAETKTIEVANNGEGKYYYAAFCADGDYKIEAAQNDGKVMVYGAYVDEIKNADGSWTNQVYMEQLEIIGGFYWIPAYTPVIVKSTTSDDVTATLATNYTGYSSVRFDAYGIPTNKIQTTPEEWYGLELKEYVATVWGADYVPYILAPIEQYGCQWAQFKDTRNIPEGSFYIVANNWYKEYPARLNVVWTDETEEATAIQSVKKTAENGAMYNLAGQKVDASYKGVVIKDGKKMIQK